MSKEETIEAKLARIEGEKEALAVQNNDLKTKFSELETKHANAETTNTELTGQLTAKTTEFNELQEKHSKLSEESVAEITKLSQEIESVKADAAQSILSVTVDGKKYTVIGKKFNLPGVGVISAADLIKDKNLLKELVAKEVGFLVPAK